MSVKFYDNSYENNYEELITYYPRFYRDVLEMEAILKYFGGVCDDMEARTEQAYLNNFILWADEPTIKEWEDFLGIVYDKPLTLDQRRRVILGRISGSSHIGEPEIRALIAIYTDCDITVDFALGVIYIDIDGEIFDEGNLYQTLLNRIPAHLALKMTARTIRKFPMTLNFNFGGAVGQEILAQPVGEEREIRHPLRLSAGAFDMTHSHIEPGAAKWKTEADITLSHGAAIGRERKYEPQNRDRRTETEIPLATGVYHYDKTPTVPQGKDRTSRTGLTLTGAGAYGAEQKDPVFPEERSAHDTAKSSRGFYCRTHIKTKRVKED